MNPADVPNAAPLRLSGGRLIVARAVWLTLALLSLGLFAASLPIYYARIQQACVDVVTCSLAGALTAQGIRELPSLGLTLTSYALLMTTFFAFIVAIWSGIGFLIFWRTSNDWFALLSALFLTMFNTTYPGFPASALALTVPVLNAPIMLMSVLGLGLLAAFLVLFPNGRLVPRWMGIFLVLAILSTTSTVLPPDSPFNSNNVPGWVNASVNIVVFGSIIGSQVYRYLRVSTRSERQQTKWVVFGIILVLIGTIMIPLAIGYFAPSIYMQPNLPSSVIIMLVYPLLLLSLPLTIGASVLRSRLFDIDVIINRTLAYGALTLALAVIYAGLIIGLETSVRLVTGQTRPSPLIIVVSTLAVAALGQPLRAHIQRGIDRRFYRRKYDAAKTVAAFTLTMRNELDLNQLSGHLVSVVEDTMQPAHVSLWLQAPAHHHASHHWAATDDHRMPVSV